MQGQTKVTMVSTEMKMKQDLSQQEFVQNVLLKSFELSKPLDETLQSIVNSYSIAGVWGGWACPVVLSPRLG